MASAHSRKMNKGERPPLDLARGAIGYTYIHCIYELRKIRRQNVAQGSGNTRQPDWRTCPSAARVCISGVTQAVKRSRTRHPPARSPSQRVPGENRARWNERESAPGEHLLCRGRKPLFYACFSGFSSRPPPEVRGWGGKDYPERAGALIEWM